MDQKLGIPHYLNRINFTSPEDILHEILGARHGQRYTEYRNSYFHSLNAADHETAPEFAHTVTMELVNRCNLTCGMCYVANHAFPKATLALDQIEGLIDAIAAHGRTGILLGVGSEGLLYKDIRQVIKYANQAGIIDIIMMTNGTLLSTDFAEFLVEQQVSRVCISVDAASPETYEKVRGKNELALLERNILGLVAAKKRQRSPLPIMRLSFCVTEDNHLEQNAFHKKWQGVVDYLDYQKVSDNRFVGREDDAEIPATPADPDLSRAFCTKPFGYLNVWSNGDISPCCNFYGKSLTFGNIINDSLEEVYNGEQMANLRQEMISGDINKVCRVCLFNRENLIDDAIKR